MGGGACSSLFLVSIDDDIDQLGLSVCLSVSFLNIDKSHDH